LHYVADSVIKSGVGVGGGVTLTGLIPTHVCTCPNPGPKCSTISFVFSEWRWKIDIGRIVDHQLFKFSFHNYMVVIYSGTPICLPRCVNFTSTFLFQLYGYVLTFLTTFYNFLILMTCKNEYNNVPMYFSSGISTIFGYSDADWKFNMGTKARNAFWMSENKQTTYLLNMCFGSRWQRQQETILKWGNIGIIFIYTSCYLPGGCLSPNIHFIQHNFKRDI
jgi:hypothetical protein